MVNADGKDWNGTLKTDVGCVRTDVGCCAVSDWMLDIGLIHTRSAMAASQEDFISPLYRSLEWGANSPTPAVGYRPYDKLTSSGEYVGESYVGNESAVCCTKKRL
jgi:hypothetical protein